MENIKKNRFSLITVLCIISFANCNGEFSSEHYSRSKSHFYFGGTKRESDFNIGVSINHKKELACSSKCVSWETCKELKQFNQQDLKTWVQEHPCYNGLKKTFAKVCCPSIETSNNYQCPTTSFPLTPETGCCGHQESDTNRNIAQSDHGELEHETYIRLRSKRATEINPGDNSVTGRIIKGQETELSEFPWTVFINVILDTGLTKESQQCGGSLISSRYVLTAAHCVYNENREKYKMTVDVFLAEYNLNSTKDCKLVYGQGEKCIDTVERYDEDVIIHPEYNNPSLKNDIALIRLTENAPYTKYIRPICLPSINVNSFDKIRMAVVGWGYNGDNNVKSNIKQSTTVNLVPNDKCRQVYPGLSGGQMCALGENGQDSCKGDSGGPLMRKNKNGYFELVGVVSGQTSKSSCGTKPALYTNVYYYLSWIHRNIKK